MCRNFPNALLKPQWRFIVTVWKMVEADGRSATASEEKGSLNPQLQEGDRPINGRCVGCDGQHFKLRVEETFADERPRVIAFEDCRAVGIFKDSVPVKNNALVDLRRDIPMYRRGLVELRSVGIQCRIDDRWVIGIEQITLHRSVENIYIDRIHEKDEDHSRNYNTS